MATRQEKWEDENKGWLDIGIDTITDFFKQTPPDESYVGITEDIRKIKNNEEKFIALIEYFYDSNIISDDKKYICNMYCNLWDKNNLSFLKNFI